MIRILLSIVMCFFFVTTSFGQEENPQPLSADKAFQFSSSMDEKGRLLLEWNIAPDYYLYKDRVNVVDSPDSEVKIDTVKFPAGKTKKDEINGTYQIYTGNLKIPVNMKTGSHGILKLDIKYQGCSAKGFCYPPIKKAVRIDLNKVDSKTVVITGQLAHAHKESEQGHAQSILNGSSNFVIILTFLGLGLLLSFTPCVLPMIPILSGIIVGHKHITASKAFFVSLVYVLGMAITYAIAGIIVAMVGGGIQTAFQKAWVIILFSGLFVVLSLSLFGYYDLELPKKWRQNLTKISNKQKGGTYFGAFLMGVLSSLIVSPCVSAPLVGVLAYIAETGNMVLGGFALLALGFGMGIPLLLIGTSAGKWLPKAGGWMEVIKKFFGILMLAMAIWMLSRVLPGSVILFLWAVLAICTAMFIGVFSEAKKNSQKLLRGLGLVLLIYGIILIIGALKGNTDPLRPLTGSQIIKEERLNFVELKNMAQFEDILAEAKRNEKPVLLDFYADWCTSCILLERQVFTQGMIQERLKGFVLVRANVTDNNEFDQALLKRFHVIAPPTILFFNTESKELAEDRIVGEVNANEFMKHLQQLDLLET